MSLFKENVNKKTIEAFENRETVEQFLARGGIIEKIAKSTSNKSNSKVKANKIDAQALLNAAMGTDKEQEVINFLKTQGIEVE